MALKFDTTLGVELKSPLDARVALWDELRRHFGDAEAELVGNPVIDVDRWRINGVDKVSYHARATFLITDPTL